MKLVYESRHYVYNLKSNIAREYTSGIHVYQFSIQRVYISFHRQKTGFRKLQLAFFHCEPDIFSVQLISAFIKMVNSCRVSNEFNYDECLIYSCYLNVF